MKRIKMMLLSISMLVMAVPAAAEVITNDMSDIPFGAFIPCPNGDVTADVTNVRVTCD